MALTKLDLRLEDQPSTDIHSAHNLISPVEAIGTLHATIMWSAQVYIGSCRVFLLRCSECSRYRTQCRNCVFEEHDVLGMSI